MEKITKLLTLFVGLLFAMTTSASVAETNETYYNLRIDGTRVTSDNASDIKGNGVFVYDASANTLYINGSYTSTSSSSGSQLRIVESNNAGLTVVVNSDAVLTNNYGPVFMFSKSGSITGSGKLTVNSPEECGFYVSSGSSLTIYDADDIDIHALWGIAGPMPDNQQGEKVTINNSNVTVDASGSNNSYAAAISDLPGGLELIKCEITAPVGAYFDTKDVKDANGNVAKNVTISNTMTTTIDGINYELTLATHEAKVIWGEYTGDITIPATVTYDSETYSVTTIKDWALSYAPSSITSINLPEGLTTIGMGVFNSLSSLTTVSLPSTLTSVGQYQFLNCSALETVFCYATTPPVVPDEVGVFVGLPNSVMLFVPEGSVSEYKVATGWSEFNAVYGIVTSINTTIDGINYEIDLRNQTAEVVGNWTTGYSGDITIPSSVTYNGGTYPVTAVRGYSFLSSAITSVTVSEGLTTIGDGAFNGCLSLTTVSLPSTLTSVGQYLFTGMPGDDMVLESVYCYATTPPVVVGEGSVYMIPENNTATLYVPAGSLSAYQNATGWSSFNNIVEMSSTLPSGVDLIVNGTFEDSDLSPFYYHRGQSTGYDTMIPSSFVQTEGGNKYFTIESVDGSDEWTTAFFVNLTRPVEAGEKLIFTMRAKANRNVSVTTQAHTTPGGYQHYEFVGSYDLTTEWQTFTKEVTITGPMAGSQCIAFMLNREPASAVYYFDDLHLIGANPTVIDYGDNMIINGDFEGTDMDAFEKNEQYVQTSLTLDDVILDAASATTNHCLLTHFGQISDGQTWLNQFLVNLNGTLAPGEQFRFSMRAKTSSGNVSILGNGQDKDNYAVSVWGLLGNMDLTDEWQTFVVEGTVAENAEGPINQLRFFLPVDEEDGIDFYFDDMTLTKKVGSYTDISQIDNTVYLEPVLVAAGGQQTLSVKMKNTEPIQGYMFTLALPEGVTVATNDAGLPMAELSTARTTTGKTDYFSANITSDGSLRVVCTSTRAYTFEGNDGEVARVTINVSPDMAVGNYYLQLKDVSLSNINNESFRTDLLTSPLSVVNVIPGDVNGDMEVDVADFTVLANYLLGKSPKVFIVGAADVAGGPGGAPDGSIDIADLTGIANIILHK